ncbi:MAG: OmpA family protein [Polyangiaceae bacterium]|nr:OmpA family protein [Polyangiaceae bacterium]
MRNATSLAGAMLFGFVASTASAQTTFQLDRAQPSGAPDDGFMVWRPYMAKEMRFYANAGVGFSLNPLRAHNVTSDDDVKKDIDNPIGGQFLLYPSVGIELLGRVGFNMMLPVTMGQLTGTDPTPEVGEGGLEQMKAAVGDLRFDTRGVIYISADQKTRIGGAFSFTIPTSGGNNFGGDNKATAKLLVSAEHHFRDFFLTGHIGPHFRPGFNLTGTAADLSVGSELRYAFGVFVPLRDGKVRLGAELWGSTGIQGAQGDYPSTFFYGNNTTLEWLAQGRFAMNPEETLYLNVGGGTRLSPGYGGADLRILTSIGHYWELQETEAKQPPEQVKIVSRAEHYESDLDGDGYPDGIDRCPELAEDGRAPKPNDGCPGPEDADGDGIVDKKDKCPNDAEDFDGIQDGDGCPELDADNDSVPDDGDACPFAPGPASNVSEPGCPSLTKVSADGHVDLLKPIEFERGRAVIKDQSLPILDEVYALMKAQSQIRIAVHGHTDNVGSEPYNLDLSQKRSDSVMAYLVEKGIAAERLEAEGFGPSQPIDTNDTKEGRARNRRVEFIILKSESESTPAAAGQENQDEEWE